MKKEMLVDERNILQNYMHSWTSLWEGGGEGEKEERGRGRSKRRRKEQEEEKRKEERKEEDSLDIKRPDTPKNQEGCPKVSSGPMKSQQ